MSRPDKIYLEEITSGNRTQLRTTVNETTFHNWQAVALLMSGSSEQFGYSCRYFVGKVEWTEVTNDE